MECWKLLLPYLISNYVFKMWILYRAPNKNQTNANA